MPKTGGMKFVDVSCAQNHSIASSTSSSAFTREHNALALSQQLSVSLHDQCTDMRSYISPISISKHMLDNDGHSHSMCF